MGALRVVTSAAEKVFHRELIDIPGQFFIFPCWGTFVGFVLQLIKNVENSGAFFVLDVWDVCRFIGAIFLDIIFDNGMLSVYCEFSAYFCVFRRFSSNALNLWVLYRFVLCWVILCVNIFKYVTNMVNI